MDGWTDSKTLETVDGEKLGIRMNMNREVAEVNLPADHQSDVDK